MRGNDGELAGMLARVQRARRPPLLLRGLLAPGMGLWTRCAFVFTGRLAIVCRTGNSSVISELQTRAMCSQIGSTNIWD